MRPGVVGKKIEDVIREAVRAGADGETDDAVDGEGFVVEAAQLGERCVSIGEGLKIGDELLRFVLALHDLFAGLQLGGDTQAVVETDRPRTGGIAKDAAAGLPSAVAIGTAETGIDGDFVHPVAELLLELIRIEVIALLFHGETMPRKGKGGQIPPQKINAAFSWQLKRSCYTFSQRVTTLSFSPLISDY